MYFEYELNDNTGRNPEYIFMYIKQYSVVGICDDMYLLYSGVTGPVYM